MVNRQMYSENDPRHHTAKIKEMLNQVSQHTREDVQKVDDPRAQALFETTAEVVDGLLKAYEDYENKAEPAWTGTARATR